MIVSRFVLMNAFYYDTEHLYSYIQVQIHQTKYSEISLHRWWQKFYLFNRDVDLSEESVIIY